MVNAEAVAGFAGSGDKSPTSSFIGSTGRRMPKWRPWKVEGTLAAADALAAAAAIYTVLWLTTEGLAGAQGGPATLALAGAVLTVCLHRLLGIFDTWRCSPFWLLRQRFFAALVTAGCIALAAGFPAGNVFGIATWLSCTVALVSLGSIGSLMARTVLMRTHLWCEPVVLVGDPNATEAFAAALLASPESGYLPVERIASPASVEGSLEDIDAYPQSLSSNLQAQCAILLSQGDSREDQRVTARLQYPTIIILPDVGALQTLGVEARAIGNAAGLSIHRSLLVPRNLLFKRLFDLMVSLPALVIAIPVIALSALAVWLIDRGNPFYSQLREGQHGQPIRVWKLRTMFRDAELRLAEYLADHPDAQAEWQRRFKLSSDPRILPFVGNFLRRSSFDELPQLWNVVRGDMSLVGPRPFPHYHLDTFSANFRKMRASVVPGLTGLWQVQERSLGDIATQERCDTFYIRNWSIWLDLYIILQTIPSVLSGRGAR